MGIVIIPVLLITGSFLSAYKTMSVFYGTSNLLSMGAAHLTASFYNAATAFTAVNSYSPFGWIINYSAEKLSANKFIFGNIVITAVNLFSLVFCGYTIVKNIMALKKGEMTKEEKYLRFIPMTLVFVGFITVWLLNFIGAVGISGYYLPTIFGYILTVFAFIGMKEKFNKPALKIKGFTFSVVDVVSIALLFLSVITFALAVPAFIGVPASIGLFSFNVLSGKVFV